MTPRRRIQLCLIRSAATLSDEQSIVDFQNAFLRAVAAMGSFVLLPHNRKLVENVGHCVAGLREVALEHCQLLRCLTLGLASGTIRLAWQIEVEEGGVQFTANLEAALGVPRKWWSVVAAVVAQGC